MFFGLKKVSPGFHLASTWLTALGASISALWILIANAWMQYPVGMEFDPGQMRNIMDDFWAVVLSPVAINKFFHAVFDGWVVGAVFVCGVSAWYMMKKRRREFALDSIRIAGWVGLVGILLTLWTGDGSAVQVAKVQPMKLAAMEGLYQGKVGQEIVGVGILNPSKKPNDGQDPFLFEISIPYGLSILANHDPQSFVPGIDDLLNGIELTPEGDTIRTDSYAERIAIGKRAHESLRAFDTAMTNGDRAAMEAARAKLKEDYRYFGYGYLDSPEEAVPPVGMTFYSFHIMVIAGGYLLLFFVIVVFTSRKGNRIWEKGWWQWIAMLTIPVVWICSEAGWVTAEVGRQPWIIESLMPDKAAISAISASTVQLTFWMFAAVFTALLIAEITIMINQIRNGSDRDEY
ncbi:MAG: cytochrome ubiquinol oxidase subunit I, partial [Duncaniella sp.]|nr:cytochrome ubiquinol oxidase subunit I [Duncaniella sp.]